MRRVWKVGLLLALVAAGGALAFAGASPEGYLGVAAVATDPAAFAGKDVQLKGTVAEGSLARNATPLTFVLTDGGASLPVRWDPARPLPDDEAGGTVEGKNVVVKGVVQTDASGPFLLAREMQVGCASKYRAA